MAESKLRVNLIGDASSLNRSLQIATARLDAFGRKATQIGRDLSLRLTLPIGLAAGASIKMASDMEESTNKVRVAFGSSAKDVQAFAKTALRSFGIAESSALDMTALFGDMATGMGVSQNEAASLSTRLVGLAGDLASFKNINIEEVTTALSGVFTGETESLKRLGIVMTEVNLEQFRMEQGIEKTVKQMTQQEKIMLRLNYIFGVTKNAQGDFARTSDGAANQMRIFQETLKELGAELGQILLPTFTKIVTKLNELLEDFKNLDKGTQESIVQFALFVAAVPPLIFAIGQIATALKGLGIAITFLTGGTGIPLLIKLLKGLTSLPLGSLTAMLTLGGDTRQNQELLDLAIRRVKIDKERLRLLKESSRVFGKAKFADAVLPFGKGDKVKVAKPQDETQALDNMLRAAEKQSQAVDEMLKNDAQLTYSLATNAAGIEYFGNTISRVAEEVRTPMENINEKVKELSESAVAFLMQVGSSLQTAFAQMLNGEGIIESLGNAIKDLIKKLIAAAAAAAVLAAIISSITGIPFSASFKASFGALNGFGGGIPLGTSGTPTGMGNLGISGAIGNNINLSGQFRLDGQDLVVAVQRANNQRGNFIG